ncbi:hypothetical protein I4U23_027638 [Adineta vaga]|nr:hypothetical protein I4U23_027638 [Adineta vaga]
MKKTTLEYLTFQRGKWINKLFIEYDDITKFKDIKFFYANIIDYIRIILCLFAAYTITTDYYLLTASLIFTATLLDWLDGPVARAYNQCSILGCGLDWSADLLSQIVMIIWWARYDFNVVPWLLIATFIEVITGIFDYATTTTLKYPILRENQTGFFIILNWTMPLNSYTQFGNFLWYSYPSYCILRTLECCYGYNKLIPFISLSTAIQEQNYVLILFLLNRYCLLIPSIFYIWCEAAYGLHILRSWREPSRKIEAASNDIIYDDAFDSYQGGFIHYKVVSNKNKILLENSYEELQFILKDRYELALSNYEVFWINLWKRTGNLTENILLKNQDQLNTMVNEFIQTYYHLNTVLLDGYGYILNPINSHAQVFHIDYTLTYSTLFIPLVPLSVDNATQYLIPSLNIDPKLFAEATKNFDKINVDLLLQDQNYYSVRQCIANPFTVLKMDFGTIHRAISNQGTYHRVMFYISVIKKDQMNQTNIPDEPLIATIKKDL